MGLGAGDGRPARGGPRGRPAGTAAAGHRRNPVRGHGRRRQRHPAGAADRPSRRRGRVPRPLPASLLSSDQDVRARLRRFGLRQIGAVADLPAPRSSPGSARRASCFTTGPGAWRSTRSGRGEPRNVSSSRCRSSRPSRSWTRSGSSCTASPGRWPTSSRPAAPPPRGPVSGCRSTSPSPPAPPRRLAVEQRFPEPTADAEAIERLLFARLERTPPPAPVARVELELAGVEPAVGQQLPLFVPQAARNARLGWQLARLALTFGDDRVRRVALADPDAPLAEARWTWRP